MDFGVIAPIAIMKEVSKFTRVSMYLYHLFENPNYKKSFQEDSNFRIIDNGAFELTFPPENKEYIKRIIELSPEEVIAPDVPNNFSLTLRKTTDFINKYFDKLGGISIQAVIQAKTFDEAIKCYEYYLKNPAISTIGFPYRMHFRDSKGGRKELIDYLIKEGLLDSKKNIHLLGLSSLNEVIEISRTCVVRSCDSSKFYLHAKQGISYYEQLPAEEQNMRLDFEEGVDEKCLNLLKENMKTLKNKIELR